MARLRFDQSQWLIHFIHDYDPDKDPNYLYRAEEVELWKPYVADEIQNRRFAPWEGYDREYGLTPGATARDVLLKVLDDGHIRSGWSYRNKRPTIWGDHSACCFTEMPLYSLIEYADRRRRGDKLVRKYGVALLRDELHRSGGRHVIYGLSRPERDVDGREWPRRLHTDCGIGLHEQYRYVPTRMGNFRGSSDWTHEREWRWADLQNRCGVPGLPIWLSEPPQFSQVRLIVETDKDAHFMKEKLKQLYDAGKHRRGYGFNRDTLFNTGVISLEQIAQALGANAIDRIRIDDIAVGYCTGFEKPKVSQDLIARMREVVTRAKDAAAKAASEYRSALEDWPTGLGHLAGRFFILVNGAQSAFLQATLDAELALPRGGYGYELRGALDGVCTTDHLQESFLAAKAAEAVIQEAFPEARLWVGGELEG